MARFYKNFHPTFNGMFYPRSAVHPFHVGWCNNHLSVLAYGSLYQPAYACMHAAPYIYPVPASIKFTGDKADYPCATKTTYLRYYYTNITQTACNNIN